MEENSMDEFIKSYLADFKQTLNLLDIKDIKKIAQLLILARENKKPIFILGNGGSAVIAAHMACDLNKGTLRNIYNSTEKRFNAQALTINPALITALANDIGYDNIFIHQLENHLSEGDIVIGISGSGNSTNIIKALEFAKRKKATTIGILGFDGGKIKDIVDFKLHIKNKNYGIIESIHDMLSHLLCSYIFKFDEKYKSNIKIKGRNVTGDFNENG